MNKIPLLFSGGETQPSDLRGLKLWLDASTLTGADGSAVTAWTDRSINQANFYQSTTASQPTLQTNELNGKNVVRFDGVDDFMNLTAPLDVQPTTVSANNACSWSRNGSYLFHSNSSTSPYHFLYKVTGNQFNKMADLSPLTSITSINASAWSANDTYLALACSSATQRLLIFKRTGDTFTKLTDPVSPNGNITAVDWYFDGSNHYLACSGSGDRLFLYKNSGDTFNQLTAPATLPAGTTSNYCAFSPDGSKLFVSANVAPFITFYSRSGDTFTKLNDPTTALAVVSLGSDWVDNDNIVVGLSGSVPRLYTWDGTTLQQGSTVGSYASANNSKFDSTKTYLAVATATTPFFRVYSRSGTTYTLLNTPSSLPTSTGRGVAWSPDSNYLAVSHTNAPFIQIYRFDGTTLTNLNKLNILRNVSGASVFVVRKCNSFATTSINVSVTTPTSGAIRLYSAQISTSKARTSAKRLDADVTANLDATTLSTTNFEVIGHIVDYANNDAFLYLNGVLDASSTSFGTAGNTADTDSAVVTVGSFTGSSYLNGDIAEVIIYDRALTSDETAQINDYLQNKYYIYNPKEISGLQLWLDASTINQVDGTAVTSWADLSGNAYDAAQATTASQPTYKTNIQNGLGVVSFDGVDDFLSLSTGLGMLNNVSGATVIVVGRYAFNGTAEVPFSAAIGGGSTSYRVALFTTNANKYQLAVRRLDSDSATSVISSQVGSAFTGAIHAGIANYSTTRIAVYVNGVIGNTSSGGSITSGNTSATDSTYIYVGKYGAAGFELSGDICEIVVYNRALDANEFRQLHQYLGRKWGITIA